MVTALVIGCAAYFSGAMSHLFIDRLPEVPSGAPEDTIIPEILVRYLPEPLLGLILVLLLSASMSTLSGIVLVSSSAVTIDLYKGVVDPEEVAIDNDMKKLLHEREGMENRNARFRTVIALVWNGKTYTFDGIVNGTITTTKRGENGFGYDPIFIPEGYEQTFAELGNDIKNQISHRAKAVEKLDEFLTQLSDHK